VPAKNKILPQQPQLPIQNTPRRKYYSPKPSTQERIPPLLHGPMPYQGFPPIENNTNYVPIRKPKWPPQQYDTSVPKSTPQDEIYDVPSSVMPQKFYQPNYPTYSRNFPQNYSSKPFDLKQQGSQTIPHGKNLYSHQGKPPSIHWPPTPMHLQNKGNLMTRYMPQLNPAPSVHDPSGRLERFRRPNHY
jgi:hypothetical protein